MDGALPIDYRLDDFRIVSVLGQGGFGVTYKAVDERLERMVAIKEYLPRQFATRESDATVRARSAADAEVFEWGRKRFIDEARALAKFKHPNIVAVIRYLEANGTAYLVMEYEEGRDLEKWLAGRSERPSEDVIVGRILLPVLDGLEKIHNEGLLHRDIKPENLFIRKDGTPVVIDFGSSRAQGSGSAPMTSIVSAGYSPFEQYGAGEGQGPWSDLYALAGTMYRAVVGRAPTDAISRYQGAAHESAREAARGNYSDRLLAAIDAGLALNAADRPQSAQALRSLLGDATAASAYDTGATRVRSQAETLVVPVRSSSSVAPKLLVLALLLAAGGTGLYYFYPKAPEVEQATAVVAPAVDPDVTPSDPQPEVGRAVPAVAEVVVPAQPTEDDIIAGMPLSEGDRNHRTLQIDGILLAYLPNRRQFDECLKNGCADLSALQAKLGGFLSGETWRHGEATGELKVARARLTERPDCPFLLDVVETVAIDQIKREQTRTYCTTNGLDRVLQHGGDIAGM